MLSHQQSVFKERIFQSHMSGEIASIKSLLCAIYAVTRSYSYFVAPNRPENRPLELFLLGFPINILRTIRANRFTTKAKWMPILLSSKIGLNRLQMDTNESFSPKFRSDAIHFSVPSHLRIYARLRLKRPLPVGKESLHRTSTCLNQKLYL